MRALRASPVAREEHTRGEQKFARRLPYSLLASDVIGLVWRLRDQPLAQSSTLPYSPNSPRVNYVGGSHQPTAGHQTSSEPGAFRPMFPLAPSNCDRRGLIDPGRVAPSNQHQRG